MTSQKELESALRANDRLALAGRLSATIAHEIHNPLETVGNILFLLGQKMSDEPELQTLLRAARNEVEKVAEISRNMLTLHRESRVASKVHLSSSSTA